MKKPQQSPFVFFYGGIFSQWYACSFTVDGVRYNCAEQYMMAQKARLFCDGPALAAVMSTNDPSKQKAIGKRVKGFDKAVWEAVARDIVRMASMAKFTSSPHLYRGLMETEGKELVEASPTDVIWGIGMVEGEEGIEDRANWRGPNWLGECLMDVRKALIASRDTALSGL